MADLNKSRTSEKSFEFSSLSDSNNVTLKLANSPQLPLPSISTWVMDDPKVYGAAWFFALIDNVIRR